MALLQPPQVADATINRQRRKDENMKRMIVAFSLLFAAAAAHAEIKGEPIEYRSGDTVLKGYIAYDDSIQGKRPGVLVVHEWWGLNDYVRKRARMLAELGYTALALDMYGDGKMATHPDDAKKFSSAVKQNWEAGKARFMAALDLLKSQPTVDPEHVAAIGYCFGGGVVLEMARAGTDLDGVVSFHGSLGASSPAEPGKVKARVLVYNGADDPFTKPEAIDAFKKEMDAAGVSYEFVNLPGAKHSFTNPDADKFGKEFNLPLAYNAEADKTSWAGMQAFFKEIFGK
jgi:dienelactone hydrolase